MELDEQRVKLLDYMGNDASIVDAAKVSFNDFHAQRIDTDGGLFENEIKLIRYLLWHRHTSPFEMVEFKFLLHIPIFVARQLVRHRTASMNEVSRRYTDKGISFFDYELRFKDDSITKQGSGSVLPRNDDLYSLVDDNTNEAFITYIELIAQGVSKETARIVLPLNTMTTIVWKMDLHNLFHFLDLRLDERAQKEIRLLAIEIFEIVKSIVPVAAKAFSDWKYMKDKFMKEGYQAYKEGAVALWRMTDDAK